MNPDPYLALGSIIGLVGVILGLVLFFSPLIIISRLGKISMTLQDIEEKFSSFNHSMRQTADILNKLNARGSLLTKQLEDMHTVLEERKSGPN